MLLVLNLLISKYISHQHKILISLNQEHISSLFRTLWWYPISLRVNAKVLTMVRKSYWISLNPHPPLLPTISATIDHHTFFAQSTPTALDSLMFLDAPMQYMPFFPYRVLSSQTSFKYPFKYHFICELFPDNLHQ